MLIFSNLLRHIAIAMNGCCCIQKESIHLMMGAFLLQKQPFPKPTTACGCVREDVAVYNFYIILSTLAVATFILF